MFVLLQKYMFTFNVYVSCYDKCPGHYQPNFICFVQSFQILVKDVIYQHCRLDDSNAT